MKNWNAGAMMGLCLFLGQAACLKILEELDDPSAHAFDDWFADAGKGGDTSSEEGGAFGMSSEPDHDLELDEVVKAEKDMEGDETEVVA